MNRSGRLVVMLAAAAAAILLTPFWGSKSLDPADIFSGQGGAAVIFWQIRVPRVMLAVLGGSALAVSGLSFQALFRNPLATPFTLGVSMGASLGAALYVTLGLSFSLLNISGVSLAAFAGALLAVALVYGLTRLNKELPTVTMLLAGVAVSFCFSSVILFLQYIGDYSSSFRITRWLMGGLETVRYGTVLNVLPFCVVGSAILLGLGRELNLMSTGEDIARSRGVNTVRTKRIVFFATSLMIGGVVAACGPIGFIGMMVPHICRLLLGVDHRILIPAALAFGGAFLALCDAVARVVIAPLEVPVGIITAMIGGPFFLWLLLAGAPGSRS